MEYDIVNEEDNEVITTCQNGSVIKCRFLKDKNKKAVDNILDNLMKSYEERINPVI